MRPRKLNDVERFKSWLRERGAELLEPTNQYEVVRFRAAGRAGIIYEDKQERRTLTGEALGAWPSFKNNDDSWKPVQKTKRKAKTDILIKTLIARDGNECFYCSDPFTEDRQPTREHLVALAHEGPNHISNSFLACFKCNEEAGHLSAPEKIRMRDRKRRGRGSRLLMRSHDRLVGGEGDPSLVDDIVNFLNPKAESE